MILLVGSRALKYFGINVQREGIQDWDFLATISDYLQFIRILQDNFGSFEIKETPSGYILKFRDPETEKLQIIEVHIVDSEIFEDKYGDNEIYDLDGTYYCMREHPFDERFQIRVADPDVIFAMKLSHKFKDDVHFEKTRSDILMLESRGFFLDKHLEELSERRAERTYRKKYKLNVSKKEFFTDNVPYKYDHDSLHLAVKRMDKPAYMYFQKDGSEVMCDRNKFEALPYDIRLNAVIEESSVLALERAVIPFNADPVRAYRRALRSVCTGVTSGWFRDFAWDNYDKALQGMGDFVQQFKIGLESGIVQPHRS